jgi:hypothetical protein
MSRGLSSKVNKHSPEAMFKTPGNAGLFTRDCEKKPKIKPGNFGNEKSFHSFVPLIGRAKKWKTKKK